jgi:Zinc carboxypeptidase
MTASRGVVMLLAACVAGPVAAAPAAAQDQGRVFPEPRDSTDFITRGPKYAPEQFKNGMLELQKRYPRYLRFSTIRQEMHQPLAVSVGEDGVPAWDPKDTGDGQDFEVVTVADSRSPVPDKDKGYVLFTSAHAAEYCGRESIPRLFEDLVRMVSTKPHTMLDGGTGIDGKHLTISVANLLKRDKLIFIDVSPDGWVAGEKNGVPGLRLYDQSNGAGVNGNRLAYQDGWIFPDDPVLRANGYSTETQPEGIATTQYLRHIRETELKGRPFAASMDWHGPAPVGAMIFHDQGADPAKLDRLHDLAERVSQAAYGVLAQYATPQGAELHKQFADSSADVRRDAFQVYNRVLGGEDEKTLYLTLNWNEYATAWEHIDYTVSSSFGGWASSNSGLDADAYSHEMPCEAVTGSWNPRTMQLYVDNIRAMATTMAVDAAFRNRREVIEQHGLGGKIGFVDTGKRITDADGNPSPPPLGVRTPLSGELRQTHYDVSDTDYFRDLRRITPTPIEELSPHDVEHLNDGLSTVVVADHDRADPAKLAHFTRGGGNVVLTDSALRLLPGIIGVPADSVVKHYSYVGYADLDRDHPWTKGLYKRARQMFDPVGLGYPLLMERDQYWPCDPSGSCDESITQNSAPMWTVDRAAWEAAGGTTIATADPPDDRKQRYEGTATDKTIIGTLPLGKGRLVIFGGVLPQPTELYSHWFGLDAYTISIPGQQLLLHGLTWKRPA